jgi:hypothetical protein
MEKYFVIGAVNEENPVDGRTVYKAEFWNNNKVMICWRGGQSGIRSTEYDLREVEEYFEQSSWVEVDKRFF